jgi:hypothetical protein
MVETGATNTTVTDSAYAALQFWRTVLLSLSPVPGCSLGSLLLNPLNSTECTSGSPYLDCSSYYAEGALALSAATQNSSWYQTYVRFTHTKHNTLTCIESRTSSVHSCFLQLSPRTGSSPRVRWSVFIRVHNKAHELATAARESSFIRV